MAASGVLPGAVPISSSLHIVPPGRLPVGQTGQAPSRQRCLRLLPGEHSDGRASYL